MVLFRISLFITSLAALVVSGISCSGSLGIAGWGSETTNGVSASIHKKDGSPAVGATVRIRRSDYVTKPPADLGKREIYSADALTNANGRFEIKGIDSGSYSIEVSDSNESVLFTCALASGDTVDFGTDTLRPYGAVIGSVNTAGTSGKWFFVQVLGLERLVSVDSDGAFKLNDLPSGHFSVRVIATDGLRSTIVRTDQVSAVSGATVPVSMSGWNFSKKLSLNTTASGAGVSGSVFNFPVLIRLTKSNFDFSQAKSDGRDIRFLTADSALVPYEIERWDSSQSLAEIWVKMGTVLGNDSTQFVTMYWGGLTGAANEPLSNGAEVFSSAAGFQGVWHLGQPGNAVALDATANHFNQTPFNMTASSAVPGAIGGAQRFDGQSAYFQSAGTSSGSLNFPQNGTYAVSAWAFTDTLDQYYHTIACKGDNQYNLEIIPSNEWEFAEYKDGAGWDLTTSHAAEKVWTYVTGIRDGVREYLYINGTLADSVITLGPNPDARTSGFDFMIGRTLKSPADTTGYFFKGVIDEVRVMSEAPSADWVKLCYMNQKAKDALVVFK